VATQVLSLAAEPASGDSRAAAGLRRFLIASAGLVYLGVCGELWFMDHTQETLQLLPFAACLLAFVGVVWALVAPARASLLALRLALPLLVAVSVLGMYEHVQANYGFEREIRPNASTLEVAEKALHGVAPILAPGSLGLAALLAAAATWEHPALKR
jgi:hypothetical protein